MYDGMMPTTSLVGHLSARGRWLRDLEGDLALNDTKCRRFRDYGDLLFSLRKPGNKNGENVDR